MGKIGLIIGREYLTRVKKKTFILMTLLGPLLIGGFITLMIWLSMEDTKEVNVLVVDRTGLLEGRLKDSDKIKYFYDKSKVDAEYNPEKSKEEFKESKYDLMLLINPDPYKNANNFIYYKKMPNFKTEKEIQNQVQLALEDYNIAKIPNFNRADYDQIKRPIIIQEKDVNEKSAVKRDRAIVGYFFCFLIYLFILLYGVQVMRGIIEEKSNRIVEVMISSVKPFQLMMGKIIGIALVGLTQFLIWALLTFVILYTSKNMLFTDVYDTTTQATAAADGVMPAQNEQVQQLDNVFNLIYYGINYGFMLGLFLFYFVFGYLFYAAFFAAIGSAVDSEADTQQFMLPITIPLVFAITMVPAVISDPDSSTSFWASIIPFTSPVVMMVRGSMGFEPGTVWQLILSMTLLLGSFIFVTWLAGKIYRTGILMYGKKASYKELWKWLRY